MAKEGKKVDRVAELEKFLVEKKVSHPGTGASEPLLFGDQGKYRELEAKGIAGALKDQIQNLSDTQFAQVKEELALYLNARNGGRSLSSSYSEGLAKDDSFALPADLVEGLKTKVSDVAARPLTKEHLTALLQEKVGDNLSIKRSTQDSHYHANVADELLKYSVSQEKKLTLADAEYIANFMNSPQGKDLVKAYMDTRGFTIATDGTQKFDALASAAMKHVEQEKQKAAQVGASPQTPPQQQQASVPPPTPHVVVQASAPPAPMPAFDAKVFLQDGGPKKLGFKQGTSSQVLSEPKNREHPTSVANKDVPAFYQKVAKSDLNFVNDTIRKPVLTLEQKEAVLREMARQNVNNQEYIAAFAKECSASNMPPHFIEEIGKISPRSIYNIGLDQENIVAFFKGVTGDEKQAKKLAEQYRVLNVNTIASGFSLSISKDNIEIFYKKLSPKEKVAFLQGVDGRADKAQLKIDTEWIAQKKTEAKYDSILQEVNQDKQAVDDAINTADKAIKAKGQTQQQAKPIVPPSAAPQQQQSQGPQQKGAAQQQSQIISLKDTRDTVRSALQVASKEKVTDLQVDVAILEGAQGKKSAVTDELIGEYAKKPVKDIVALKDGIKQGLAAKQAFLTDLGANNPVLYTQLAPNLDAGEASVFFEGMAKDKATELTEAHSKIKPFVIGKQQTSLEKIKEVYEKSNDQSSPATAEENVAFLLGVNAANAQVKELSERMKIADFVKTKMAELNQSPEQIQVIQASLKKANDSLKAGLEEVQRQRKTQAVSSAQAPASVADPVEEVETRVTRDTTRAAELAQRKRVSKWNPLSSTYSAGKFTKDNALEKQLSGAFTRDKVIMKNALQISEEALLEAEGRLAKGQKTITHQELLATKANDLKNQVLQELEKKHQADGHGEESQSRAEMEYNTHYKKDVEAITSGQGLLSKSAPLVTQLQQVQKALDNSTAALKQLKEEIETLEKDLDKADKKVKAAKKIIDPKYKDDSTVSLWDKAFKGGEYRKAQEARQAKVNELRKKMEDMDKKLTDHDKAERECADMVAEIDKKMSPGTKLGVLLKDRHEQQAMEAALTATFEVGGGSSVRAVTTRNNRGPSKTASQRRQ